MNRPIIISLAAICIAILSAFSLWNTNQVNAQLKDQLEAAEKAAVSGDLKKAAALSEEIDKLWSEKEKWLLIYIKHNEVDDVGKSISELKYLAKFGDVAEFCSKASQTSDMIEHIWISELPLPKNVL